ncbi:MAG: hypothetical protein AAGE03_13675 [Pseudomonadota bacterium]
MTNSARKSAAGSQGSAHAAVEAPDTAASRRWLWIAVAVVMAILLLFWLVPSAVTATGIAPPDVLIADVEAVLPAQR